MNINVSVVLTGLATRVVMALVFSMGLLQASVGQAGIRADATGPLVVDFATTMDMPFMSIGNLNNGDDGGRGAVDYAYLMGKFEVTAGQYTEFLNAVAADDTYSLYNERMADPVHDQNHPDDLPYGGANIQRAGTAGSYTYSVAADWADRPVNYVSWGDVTRFANWMTNGMPTGAQDASTTEDGSYPLNGAITTADLKVAVAARKTVAEGGLYYMPSEHEWYKAAFHANDGDTSNYFPYATSSGIEPAFIPDGGSITDPDPGNVATYDGDGGVGGIGAPYYRTEVGEHENSPSPYATYDMNGNVGEWTEGLALFGANPRGGEYAFGVGNLHSSYRRLRSLTRESGDIGFRLASLADVSSSCIVGDADCDGYVDVGNDIFAAFGNFTGPGSYGMTRIQGDVQGNPQGATTNLDPHDGDVDVSDIITMFSNFTGPKPPEDQAGGLVAAEALDSTIPDLIYDASTGEVLLDLDSAVGFTGYVLNSANGFITGNHTPFMAGVTTTLPYELAEATFGTPAGPYPKSIGQVFPSGMDMTALSAFLTGNQVSRGNNQPIVPFDLVIVNPVSSGVPEPAAVVMGIMALAGLGVACRCQRRQSA